MSRRIRPQVNRAVWLRRLSVRYQSQATWKQNVCNAGQFIGTP